MLISTERMPLMRMGEALVTRDRKANINYVSRNDILLEAAQLQDAKGRLTKYGMAKSTGSFVLVQCSEARFNLARVVASYRLYKYTRDLECFKLLQEVPAGCCENYDIAVHSQQLDISSDAIT